MTMTDLIIKPAQNEQQNPTWQAQDLDHLDYFEGRMCFCVIMVTTTDLIEISVDLAQRAECEYAGV